MNRLLLHLVAPFLLFALTAGSRAQIPAQINYQGRVTVSGVNFTGNGLFKFALVDAGENQNQTAQGSAITGGGAVTGVTVFPQGSGYVTPPEVTFGGPGTGAAGTAIITNGAITGITITAGGSGYTSIPTVAIAPPPPNLLHQTYWSNVGDLAPGEVPDTAVTVPVSNGLYAVRLADPALGMAPFHADTFQSVPLFLRVWFSDGVHGFQQLTPDQPLAAAPYAFTSQLALTVPNGSIGRFQLADGAVTSFKLADGAVSAEKIAAGSVAGASLAAGAVGADKLAVSAVTSAAIAPGAAAANLSVGGNQNVMLGSGHFSGSLTSGTGTTASGLYSVAIGENTAALGRASFAQGNGTYTATTATNSMALGLNTQTLGPNSIAIGNGAAAFGSNCLSLGLNSQAFGDGALCIGSGTKTEGIGSFACGKFNDPVGYVFTVGSGGDALTRANILAVSIGGAELIGALSVSDNINYGGALVHTSDARLKDLGAPFLPGLEAIARIEPLHYHFKKDNAKKLPSEPEHIGVAAQAMREVLPEAVVEDADGYLAVKQEPVIWALVNAVKELKAENDTLKKRLEALEANRK